jgi:hypothetical protein
LAMPLEERQRIHLPRRTYRRPLHGAQTQLTAERH